MLPAPDMPENSYGDEAHVAGSFSLPVNSPLQALPESSRFKQQAGDRVRGFKDATIGYGKKARDMSLSRQREERAKKMAAARKKAEADSPTVLPSSEVDEWADEG